MTDSRILVVVVILIFLLGLGFIFMTDGKGWSNMKSTCQESGGSYFAQYTYNWCEYSNGKIVNLDGKNINYNEVKAGH